jgi:hypothetical protein
MKRWFGKLGIGSVFVLIGAALVAGGALSLATRDSTEATARNDEGDGPPWMRHEFRRPSEKEMKQHRERMQERRKQFESDLAKELGVSQEKVHQAFKNVMKKRLDQAVQDGRLTRKQADKMLACFDGGDDCEPRVHFRRGGPPPGGPPMGGPGGPGFGPP